MNPTTTEVSVARHGHQRSAFDAEVGIEPGLAISCDGVDRFSELFGEGRGADRPASPRHGGRLADELPGLLQELGWSQRELARRLGINQAYLSRALRGVDGKRVRPALAQSVAEALGLPSDFFAEVQEARIAEAIRADPVLRKELYGLTQARYDFTQARAPDAER